MEKRYLVVAESGQQQGPDPNLTGPTGGQPSWCHSPPAQPFPPLLLAPVSKSPSSPLIMISLHSLLQGGEGRGLVEAFWVPARSHPPRKGAGSASSISGAAQWTTLP